MRRIARLLRAMRPDEIDRAATVSRRPEALVRPDRSAGGDRTWSRRIRATLDSGTEARWFLGQVLGHRHEEAAFDLAALLITEIASNAARHGSPRFGSPIDLTITELDAAVRVTVRDRGGGFDPRYELANSPGWGIRLVEALARRWGVEPGRDGTEVWFEV